MMKKEREQSGKKGLRCVKMLAAAWLCLGMIFGADMTAHASGEIIFHVENQKGKAGDIVTVPVELTSNEEVGGFEIVVYYDSEAMTFQSLKKGSLIEEGSSALFDYYHNEEKSSVKIVYVVADTVKAKGTIVNMKFKLNQDCGESIPIGMGVNQLVDNSDAGEDIVSEAEVTGVDVEYQKEVEPEITSEGGNAGNAYLNASGAVAEATDVKASADDKKSDESSNGQTEDPSSKEDSGKQADDPSEDKSGEKADSQSEEKSGEKSGEKSEKKTDDPSDKTEAAEGAEKENVGQTSSSETTSAIVMIAALVLAVVAAAFLGKRHR